MINGVAPGGVAAHDGAHPADPLRVERRRAVRGRQPLGPCRRLAQPRKVLGVRGHQAGDREHPRRPRRVHRRNLVDRGHQELVGPYQHAGDPLEVSTLVGDVGPVHGVAAEQRGGVEQRAHPVERTSVPERDGCGEQPTGPHPCLGGQLGGACQGGSGGSGCSAVASPLRRVFQLHGCGLVGSDHGRGPVPGAAVTLLVGVEDVGECAVYRAPSAVGRGAVDRRAHERMAELQPVSGDGHQSGALGLVERLRRVAEGRGGGQDGGDVTGVLGGGDVQQGLGVGWQQPDTAQVGLLDSPGQRQRVGQ